MNSSQRRSGRLRTGDATSPQGVGSAVLSRSKAALLSRFMGPMRFKMKRRLSMSCKVGRVTPCAPRLGHGQTARRGLTRPTGPVGSWPRCAILKSWRPHIKGVFKLLIMTTPFPKWAAAKSAIDLGNARVFRFRFVQRECSEKRPRPEPSPIPLRTFR